MADKTVTVRKRAGIDPANILDGPRTKRRKEATSISFTLPGRKRSSQTPQVDDAPEEEGTEGDEEEVEDEEATHTHDLALKLMEAARLARGPDSHVLSEPFIKLPSKKMYPDYYEVIKKPISFDQIKANIDQHLYPSLDAVKHDFDLCFRNAMRYNQKKSPIWNDAKALQKVISDQVRVLTNEHARGQTDEEVDVDGDVPPSPGNAGSEDDGEDGLLEDEGKRKKPRTPSLFRSIKHRLTKLIDYKDPSGRVYSEPFMPLPPKREYPDYYKLIKRPISFDIINKKIRKKEYTSSAMFAADVELLFNNAFTYNEDDSLIFQDAKTLQTLFHSLMATLPPQYALNASAEPKITLKVSQPSHSNKNASTSAKKSPAPSLPVPNTVPPNPTLTRQATAQPTSAVNTPAQVTKATRPPAPTPTTSVVPQPIPYATPAPVTNVNTLKPPLPAITPVPGTVPPLASTLSPTPSIPPSTRITFLELLMQPSGRKMTLRQQDHVRCWSIRLAWGEASFGLIVRAETEKEESDDGEGDQVEEDPIEVEVKCNSAVIRETIMPAPKAAADEGVINGSGSGDDKMDIDPPTKSPLTNGHTSKSVGADSDSDESSDSEVADTKARSSKEKVNGKKKTKTKRKVSDSGPSTGATKKRGATAEVSKKTTAPPAQMRKWDLNPVVGSNIVDVKVGGNKGETWRIFVERMV